MLLLLLVALPLQSVATAVATITCDGKTRQQAALDDRASALEADAGYTGSDDKIRLAGDLGDFSCHPVAASASRDVFAASMPGLVRGPGPARDLLELFVPEQPQRPPLT